jgi:CRP-like cAMP-binding protein
MPNKLELAQEHHTKCVDCAIRKMALFKRVPHARLDWTQDYRTGQYYLKSKQHLYHEGDAHDCVYTLFEGFVKLYKTVEKGKIQVMRFASPGDLLGFQGDLTGSMHHGAQALTDCILCAFPKEQVNKMMCEHMEIATEMITKNARIMAVCQEHLLSTGARNARERIAFSLFELNYRMKSLKQFCPDRSVSNLLYLPLTQEDLADAVGLTPIHVNRTLKIMSGEKLIRCGKGKIAVLDEEALQKISGLKLALLDAGPML